MADRVRITDVAPRDGLQNEPGVVSTGDKARLVELLCASGVDEVEVSSFVSPRWVPQLADADAVFAALRGAKPEGVLFSALVPNEAGFDRVKRVNDGSGGRLIDKIAVFTAASETFSQRNTNASIAQSLRRFEPVIAGAKGEGLLVRGYVSCAVSCPFEGGIAPEKVSLVAQALADMGADEIDLGDTTGAAEPADITLLLNAMIARMGDRGMGAWVLHLHDTFGRAAECVTEALSLGIRSFDGAAGGLGGCPYASVEGRRAPGNIDSVALVRTVHAAGYATGVDERALERAGEFAREAVRRASPPGRSPSEGA